MRPPRLIAWAAVLLVAALIGIDVGVIWHLRQTAIASARDSLAKLNRVIEQQSMRTLQGAELVLDAVATETVAAGMNEAKFRQHAVSRSTQRNLARKISGLPQIAALYLVDASGNLINGSINPARRINIGDRPDFATLRYRVDIGVVISAPVLSQSGTVPTIYLARRLVGADGTFLGIASAAIRLDYFQNFYRDIYLGKGSAIGLWRADGMLLVRYPETKASDGHLVVAPFFAATEPDQSFGPFAAHDAISEESIVLAGHRLGKYPLVATTSLTISAILSHWRSQAAIIALIGLALVSAIFAIAVLLRRHVLAQVLMTRAYARLADESQARRELQRAVERAEAIAAERRLAGEALRISECRFRDIAEFSADWIWESDADHRFVFLSGSGAEEVYGKTRWQVAGADPETDPHWRRHKADLDARRPFRGFRFTISWAHGQVQHYSANGKPVFDDHGCFQGYRGTVTNETEAILAQHRASRADRLLRDAVDSISEGFVIFDADDKLVMCNEAYRRMYAEIADQLVPGVTFEEILCIGVDRGQFADAETREAEWIADRIHQHRRLEGAVQQHLSGDRWTLASERRMSDGGTAGLRIDITALKRAQMALHESQLRLDEAERIAGLGCSDYNLVTGTLTWSNETYRIFGVDIRELPPTGDDYLALVDPRDRERVRGLWNELARGSTPPAIEYRVFGGDGESRLVHRENEILHDGKGRPIRIVSTLQDVTAQRAAELRARELERLLLHSQKLEALGTMAGGLAHELNNILAPVLSLAKVALDDFPPGSATRTDLEMVVTASQRARDLVRQILAFGRQQPLERQIVDLATAIRPAVQMMRATLPASIEIVETMESAAPVFADQVQLQQVVVNLIANASEAIGERNGKIVVAVSTSANGSGQTGFVRLAVADDGCGMDALIAQRAFEPFFTTREAHRGSGLGLSVVHGIVTSHGGRIELHTAPDEGSEFSIILPAAVHAIIPANVSTAA